ncbi:hypothetical protein BKA70DRAFT_1328925 [Coprinopsis sp. MPI-PUGE-AT-0042]|nr:hypothetical protein BKA70DRAFT_1328925 [Coprinopsis sp. MPI-PUGE-AT-0042]
MVFVTNAGYTSSNFARRIGMQVGIACAFLALCLMGFGIMRWRRAARSRSMVPTTEQSVNPPTPIPNTRVNPSSPYSRRSLTQQEILDRIKSSAAPPRVATSGAEHPDRSASFSSSPPTRPENQNSDGTEAQPPSTNVSTTNVSTTKEGLVSMEWRPDAVTEVQGLRPPVSSSR